MSNENNGGDPGSWQREWDKRTHTTDEFRQEIKELRERIKSYLIDIEKRDRKIEELAEELVLLNKYFSKSLMNEKEL